MREKWELTTFGLEVRKKLLEKRWTVKDLASEIGADQSFLKGMLYGKRKGYKYLEPIKKLLDIS